MPRSSTRFKGCTVSVTTARTVLLGVLMLTPAACGGLDEGGYLVVRMAESSETRTDGCYYPNDGPSQSDISDSSSVLTSATLVVYHAGGDARVLDSGGTTLSGTQDGDRMDFTGSTTDATPLGENGDVALQTTTTTFSVGLTLDGQTVSGTRRSASVTVCEFLTATPSGDFCPNPPIPDCVIDTTFDGVVVEDVRLRRSISESELED